MRKILNSEDIHIFPISVSRTGNDNSDLGDRALSEKNLTNIIKGYYDPYQSPQTVKQTVTIERGGVSTEVDIFAYEEGYVVNAVIGQGTAVVDFIINGYRAKASLNTNDFGLSSGECIYAVMEIINSDTVYPIANGEDSYEASVKKFTGIRFTKDGQTIDSRNLHSWLIRSDEINPMYFVRLLEKSESGDIRVPRRSAARVRYIDGGIV